MRTALIKTDFWKDDSVFELTPDVRMFYLCLLTNPERNTTRAFKCSDRLMSAYTGYNHDTIKLCRDRLIKAGLIQFVDGYYILRDDSNVEPKRGKLTQSIQEKFIATLPDRVIDILENNVDTTHVKSSSAALEQPLEYVYVNDNVDVNVDNNKDVNNKSAQTIKESNDSNELKFIHSEICKLFNKSESKYKLSDKRKQKLKLRLKDLGKEGILQACEAITRSEFHMGENQRNWIAEPYWVLENFERAEKWAGEYQNNNKYADLTKLEF